MCVNYAKNLWPVRCRAMAFRPYNPESYGVVVCNLKQVLSCCGATQLLYFAPAATPPVRHHAMETSSQTHDPFSSAVQLHRGLSDELRTLISAIAHAGCVRKARLMMSQMTLLVWRRTRS